MSAKDSKAGVRPDRHFSLALGGGGARGFAHAGVLAVLERRGLHPVALAGTSMGALVGALYASGVAPDRMAETFGLLDFKGVVSVAALSLGPESVLTADKFEERLREVLPATFAELTMPLSCVATDLTTGERVVMSAGDLPRAIRASMSIPVLYEPVHAEGRVLVDGGVVDPVPVEAARHLGGDPVVAVDVSALLPEPEAVEAEAVPAGQKPAPASGGKSTAIQIGTRSLDVASHWLARGPLATAAVVITPDVGGYSIADFVDIPAIIAAGAAAAERAVPEIRALVAASPEREPGGWRETFRRAMGLPQRRD
jgi:NTE family protein